MIDNFKIFESRSDINTICRKYNIRNYTINDDMTVSVNGDVNLSGNFLDKIPLKFKEVSQHFYCYDNKIESLEGCPEIVGGIFSCSGNSLKSLEFCPRKVGAFYCYRNSLKSLEFCPKEIDGNFSCHNNNLTSLKYFPEVIGGSINISVNKITNFDGIPELFESKINISQNPVYEIYQLFGDPKCIYWIREFDVIQGNKVIKDRLEEVYVHMGLEIPKDIKFKEYILI